MQDTLGQSVSCKLRYLTAELLLLDHELKAKPSVDAATDGLTLREFRHALDNVRLTAWTVNELIDARQSQKNPQAVISFLTVQRLRRFSHMVHDLCCDFDRDGVTWSVEAVKHLAESLSRLCQRLRMRN